MAKLSSAAWMAHDVGLATSIGGTLFGRQAFQPALNTEVDSRLERDRISTSAWRRFTWINLAAHGVVAATWFVGRSMLSGREVSRTSRRLTVAKDALVAASLITGIASALLGRTLGTRMQQRETAGIDDESTRELERLRRTVGVLGNLNLAANAGVMAVTTALSMEASHSLPFAYVSRKLP